MIKLDTKTLFADIIMILVFVIIGLVWFNAIALGLLAKVLLFVAVIFLTWQFGVYKNHNYSKIACEKQGEIDIHKGKLESNIHTTEQMILDDEDGIKDK